MAFVRGQNLVFLLLITDTVTLPVGVEFFMPDPALTAWTQADKRLRKQGIAKKERPAKPSPHPDYPTKLEIALELLKGFHTTFPEIRVRCVLADNVYGTQAFVDEASALFFGVQVAPASRGLRSLNPDFIGVVVIRSSAFQLFALLIL